MRHNLVSLLQTQGIFVFDYLAWVADAKSHWCNELCGFSGSDRGKSKLNWIWENLPLNRIERTAILSDSPGGMCEFWANKGEYLRKAQIQVEGRVSKKIRTRPSKKIRRKNATWKLDLLGYSGQECLGVFKPVPNSKRNTGPTTWPVFYGLSLCLKTGAKVAGCSLMSVLLHCQQQNQKLAVLQRPKNVICVRVQFLTPLLEHFVWNLNRLCRIIQTVREFKQIVWRFLCMTTHCTLLQTCPMQV